MMLVFVLNYTRTPAARMTVRAAGVLLPQAVIIPVEQPAGRLMNRWLGEHPEAALVMVIPAGAVLLHVFGEEAAGWRRRMEEEGLGWLCIHSALRSPAQQRTPLYPQEIVLWNRRLLVSGECHGFADERLLPFQDYVAYDKYCQLASRSDGSELVTSSYRPPIQRPPAWQRREEEWAAVRPLLEAPASYVTGRAVGGTVQLATPAADGDGTSLSVTAPAGAVGASAADDSIISGTTALITIVICVYKDEEYLPWAVRSVLKQTSNNWELIIVDDASPSDVGELVASLFPAAPIYVLRHDRNRGKAAALNTALAVARGSWLLELDADDWLSCDAIEQLTAAAAAASDGVALLHSDYWEWQERSKHQLIIRGVHQAAPVADSRRLLERARPLLPRLYRLSALREQGGWRQADPFYGRLYEDMEMLIRLLRQYDSEYIPAALYHLRMRGNSITKRHASAYAAWKLWALASFSEIDKR
ncbi:glycosyltransferase family 2 protein [Paenibacillus sp. SYP-B4298]|uniref:glycosyltransferase family 2 protein n=1 Tax=Paenibacillus sp. SYP-B4298 TaxID=2996034 RepID=UPI0022DD446C|nr:glycosyltransferase family A protein [Paenibacillus sp. SYP-B4298]